MSRFLYRNFELLEPYDAKVSCTVLRGESSRKGADLLDKEYYDKLKSVHDLVKDARKVQQTVLLVGEISDIYIENFQKMMTDPNYSVDELAAISFGYTKILEEGADKLSELKNIVTSSNGLSMSDKERMDIIDKVYSEIKKYRNLTVYYTKKNISVSYLRAREKNQTDRVLALYGNANDKYW